MSLNNNINKNNTDKGGTVNDTNVLKGKNTLTKIIFGEDVQIHKYDQVTLQKAIDLKIEQERTKQQYYKLENTNKTMELLNLSSRLNIPLSQLSSLLSPVSIKSDISPNVTNSNNFKFPATSHDNNKLTVPPNGMVTHRRVNSPARIGANAVAALAINNGNRDHMIIKEEEDDDGDDDTRIDNNNNNPISPLTKKLPTFHNYITSRDNVYNAKPLRHSRNLSLPSMNKFTNSTNNIINSSSPHIPEGMTSILSFNNVTNDTFIEKPKPESAHNSNLKILEKSQIVNTLKVHNSIQKKQHRRAKSACSSSAFGVIDLNITEEDSKSKKNKIIVEEAKRKALIANILAYGKKNNNNTTTNKTSLDISKEKQEFDDMDEKTCSESSTSSKCHSPSNYNNTHTRTTSSVQKLLND